MFYRILVYVIGFILSVVGLTYVVSYLNLLTIGYTYLEYLQFIFSRKEGFFLILGLLLITYSIYAKRGIL